MNTISHLPLLVTEIEHSMAFGSADAALVRASIYLLDAAWHAPRTGSLPSDLQTLARLSRLSVEAVEENWDALFSGWDLREDGMLWHPRLCDLGRRLQEGYAEQLQAIEASCVLMAQDPEQSFDLIGQTAGAAPKPKARKTQYPQNFKPDAASLAAMERAGYSTPEDRQWLLDRFADFGQVKTRLYSNWQSAFRNFLSSHITLRDLHAYRLSLRQASQGAVAREQPRTLSVSERLRLASERTVRRGDLAADPVAAHAPQTFAQRGLENSRAVMAAALSARAQSGFYPPEGGDVIDAHEVHPSAPTSPVEK